MKKTILLPLAAGIVLLAGCSSTTRTLELTGGRALMTEDRPFGRPPLIWELRVVSSKSEMATLRKSGWRIADRDAISSINWKRVDGPALNYCIHKEGGADSFLMKRKLSEHSSALIAATPPPFRPMLITTLGTHPSSDGSWQIGVSEDSIDFNRRGVGGMGFTPDSHGWKAQAGWFVFAESESRVWAYDGDSRLYLDSETFAHAGSNNDSRSALYIGIFTESPSGNNSTAATHYRSNFPCAVPIEVISHLPERKQKEIHTASN